MSLAATIATCASAFILLRIYLRKIKYFYKGEEEYELENEQEESKNPHTGGNR